MNTRHLVLAGVLCISLFSCGESDNDNEGDYYDKFRGDKSSLVNLTQYESFAQGLRRFDFKKYAGTRITFSINAPNDFVHDQINNILTMTFSENAIVVVTPRNDDKGRRLDQASEKFDLQVNAVCGGYYFYDGLVVKNYKSITRVIMVENDLEKNKKTHLDGGYQEYRYNSLEFTDIFKVFAYLLIFTALLGGAAVLFMKKFKK